MPWLWTPLRRAARQSSRRVPARHALGRDPRRLALPGLRGVRQAGLREAPGVKRARLLAATAALALLASCSATKLAYNRLDWLVAWEIDKVVELEGPSQQLFKAGFTSLWQWHRNTQLQAYARDLREIADAAGQPMTEEQLRGWWERGAAHGRRLLDEAMPPSARVLQALDDAQVRQMLEKMSEQRREETADELERSPEETREEMARSRSRGLRRWLGPLSDAQEGLVGEWAAARRSDPVLWQRYGEHWEQAFAATLATRSQPGFEQRVRDVFDRPELPDSEAARALNEHNRDTFLRLLARLAPTLSEQQRRHFRKKLVGLAEDLEELAAQSQRAAPSGAGAGRTG